MRVVIDASVFVSAARMHEQMHQISIEFLQAISQQRVELFAPALLLPEIAGAFARPTKDAKRARDTIALINETTRITTVAVNHELAGQAAEVAARYFLRGADAIYVTLAQSLAAVLVTLDKEMLERAAGIVTCLSPRDWLKNHARV